MKSQLMLKGSATDPAPEFDKCSNCPMAGRQGRYVPGRGPEKTEFAIVGEGPGTEERRQKAPFVGPSGELLWQAVGPTGRNSSNTWVTNVEKCFIPSSQKRRYLGAASACCQTDLVAELEEHGVKYVLALGNEAMEAMLGIRGITKQRGIVRKLSNGITIVPTWHPSAILRGFSNNSSRQMAEFTRDIQLWATGCPEQDNPMKSLKYEVVENVDRAVDVLQREIRPAGYAVMDIETSGLDLEWDDLLCIVLSTGPQNIWVLSADVLYRAAFLKKLAEISDKVVWIGHNLAFDLVWIERKLGVHLGPKHFDTLLAHYCTNEQRGTHDLKQIAAQMFMAPDWEGEMQAHLPKKSASYALLPEPILWKYAAADGLYTYLLYERMKKVLNAPRNEDLHRLFFDFMLPALKLTIKMQLNGMFINLERLEERREWAGGREQEALEVLQAVAGEDYNPRSAQQTARVLYDRLGAPTWSHSATGLAAQHSTIGSQKERTTAKAQLERLTHSKNPKVAKFATDLLQYRSMHHMKTNYLDHFEPAEDGRIHPNFSLFASVTGRLASRNPNVMNMSHENGVRSIIGAEPGNVILTVDYSQMELRVAAMLSGDEVFQQVYRDGKDIHDTVSVWFYGEGYSKYQRVIAKSFVFGLLYGRGASSIAQTFGISMQEAYQRMAIIKRMMPGFDEWREKQYLAAVAQGYVGTPFGRRRRFPIISNRTEHEVRRYVVNAPIQGTASDILIISMVEIDEWIGDYGGMTLMPLHDAGNYEVPAERAKDAASRIVEVMERVPHDVFGDNCIPFVTEAEWGQSLEESALMTVEDLDVGTQDRG